MINYETIKNTAKEHGVKIDDLLALAPKNDPFYTGRPAEVKAAEWFTDLWERFGYMTGVHLRRVHYRAISQKIPILRPDGTVYENTDRCWKWLCEAGKWARYLDLVDYGAFEDRRNPDAILYAKWYKPGDYKYGTPFKDPEPGFEIVNEILADDFGGEPTIQHTDMWGDLRKKPLWHGYDLPDLPELENIPDDLPDLPDYHVTGYDDIQQDYHIEIWCEKTTMNDILKPLCEEYHANLITGAGEMSITAVVDFMERVKKAKRAARVFYVSDYDPAGLGMPISVARKVEFLKRHNRTDGLDIRLHPIVLTTDQVALYQLPRVPIKDSETRKERWEERHGEGQVELDALEALYPGVLHDIVERAILDYYDTELTDKAKETKRELVKALRSERKPILEEYENTRTDIEGDYADLVSEMEDLQERFNDLVKPFQAEIDQHKETLDDIKERWRKAIDDVAFDLGQVEIDLDDYPLPEPALPEESDGTLYVSERDYLGQLEYYTAYREGKNVYG